MNNALYLRPGVTVRGSGSETVLEKTPGVVTNLVQESDWYESAVRVESTEGFSAGCGIMLRSYEDGKMTVVKDTVTGIDGEWLLLSRRLDQNKWPRHNATAATLYPLLTAEHVDDI